MLSIEDNELIARVGPGTPMGNLMRMYWVPALMSRELEAPDAAPMRLRLLGENLIAFRVTSGAVGIVADACPHRGASLFFGRNEEDGLRCVYHGWKFDTAGNCIDMPSEPAESNFKTKVHAISYPCIERGGVVWTYMGKEATPPELPAFTANLSPTASVNAYQTECNYLQTLEGDIDTVHFGFLHRGSINVENLPPWASKSDYYAVADRTPRYKVIDTESGVMYGAYRDADAADGTEYWRTALFLFPFYTMPPGGVAVQCRVPMDDSHTMNFSLTPSGRRPIVPNEVSENPIWRRIDSGILPNTTGWLGRFRPGSNRDNDYEINRDIQRANQGNNGYTGIVGNVQDQAITESMGAIYDRSHEHLGTSDAMIIRTRRRLLLAAKALRDRGETPPGLSNPQSYAIKSATMVIPKGIDWVAASQEATPIAPIAAG